MAKRKNGTTKAAMFRSLLNRPEAVVVPAAHDALSARTIEKAGFEAIFASGAAISASMIGEPDLGLITMTEMVEANRRMVNAVSIPVFADAEAGYGNPLNVARTVKEFERAGVGGLFIEDQDLPIRCGSVAGKRLISLREMVTKIEAALDARQDPDFVIAVRTDGGMVSPEEAVKRAHAYIKAGADFIIPHVPGYKEAKPQIEFYAKEIKGKPLCLLFAAAGTHSREMTTFDVARFGYKLIVCTGMHYALPKLGLQLLQELRSKGTQAAYLEKLGVHAPHYDDFYNLLGLEKYREMERRYSIS